MNCFETLKISQQYSKIIQKIQQRNDKDPKNKKSNLLQISKANKQNVLGTQSQLAFDIQNNTKPNISCNQTVNSTTSSIQKGQQQIKDKSPSQAIPRYNYTPLTPLKNLIGNNSSLSPLSHLQQQTRNISKTIHYPQNQQLNNNVSNTILNTTNMLEDNSFVSINNHLSNIQQEIRVSQKKPCLNDQDSTQKALSQRVLVNNYESNSQNTPKRLFFNYKTTVNESLKNHTLENKNQYKELTNFKCSQCQVKNAKYQSKMIHNTGEYTRYYCSKCAIKQMEQGQKMDCIPNLKLPQQQFKNQQINSQQKNQQEEIQDINNQDSSALILKNVQLENFSSIDQKQHNNNNKKISQLEFSANFQFGRKESPNKHSSNQKENIFLPTLSGIDYYQNDTSDNSQRNLQINQIIGGQVNQKNQQTQIKQQSQNHNRIISDNKINQQLINGCNQNLFSNNQQIQFQPKQEQCRMQVWNLHESENQDDSKWQGLGPKLTFEGDSQRPSDQDLFNIQQQEINRAIIVFNDSENNQLSKNIQDSDGQEQQSDSNQKDSEIAIISQGSAINDNISQQKEDDSRQMIQQQEQVTEEDSQNQFLPQFSDQSIYEQSRQRKIQILENFSQELNLSNTRAAACLSQLAQRKKEVTKFYENQELKLQQNAQNLMQFIQQELKESIEKLRNAQVKTLSLFAEKENQLQRIYHEIQSTELDVKKNHVQIVEFMEEQPFNNIIQIYHQNLQKNTYLIKELPNQILCLSKTYQLTEKKQASAQFQQGLKDALLVQEKRTTMFGNSSYASATSTPQTASTNNNSYNIVISPRSSNNQNVNQFNFVNNQNMLSYPSYQPQKRNLSQTNSMTSIKVFTSQPNQNIFQNQPILTVKQNSSSQIFQGQVTNASPQKKQNIGNSYVQQESKQLPQSSDFGNNGQNQFQQYENIQSSFSQQNQNFQQINNNFSLQNSDHKSQFKPIVSNSISSPLIKKNNSLKNIQNYPTIHENQYIQNPYSSVENHFEQIYRPEVTIENAPSYSSVQFQRWKDCEKTIIEQIMSIEQNEMHLTPRGDSKHDIDLLSPSCQQTSKIAEIIPQNLFQSPTHIQQQNNEISVANQKNDFIQDEAKVRSDYEKNIQSQINQQNNTQLIQNQDEEKLENQHIKQVRQDDDKKQTTSKFEDLKNNYQWMVEQYKKEQNLVSSPLVPQESRNSKKRNQLAGKQNFDNLSKNSNEQQGQNPNLIQEFEQNKITRDRSELQDITYLKLQQNDQFQNKLVFRHENNQLVDNISLGENLVNKTKFKESSNQSYSSNNQTGEFQLNDNGNLQNQYQAEHNYGDQYSDQIPKDKSLCECVDLSYSASVAAGLVSTNDQTINNPNNQINSQNIQNSNNLFKMKSFKQEEQVLQKDGQFSSIQPLCQSNIFMQQEQKEELNHDRNQREASLNQIDLILNSDQKTQIQKDSQKLNHLNRQNLINSFSQNLKLSDDFIETSIIQNYINRESFSQNNDQTSYYSQNANQYHPQFIQDQSILNQIDKKYLPNEQQTPLNRSQDETSEDKNIQFVQSTALNYHQINKNELQIGFSVNIQHSSDDKMNRQLQNIAKDSFSDANYTIQHQESQEEQKDLKEDIILDINQLHDISGDEETDSGLGSNASKRPLKYSEIIQKIHENYNRLSQNCQKKNNLQKNSSYPILSQENQQETHLTNQQNLIHQNSQNNQNNLDCQQQNFKTEDSQLVFSNQEQIHLEITQNLSDLVLNKNNEHFSSFCTNMNQLEQSLNPINGQKNEKALQNDVMQISLISPDINQNEIIDHDLNFIQNSQKESENYVNTVASFSHQLFEQQQQQQQNNNYPSKEDEDIVSPQINNQVEVSPNSNFDELKANQDKHSTFSSFLDNQGCVSTKIEAQINDHINNQISQKRINFNKYSELIKSSPHFRAHKFTEDSVLSEEDDNLNEEQIEVRSTPFK